jgi:hypothetical protein
MNTSNKRHSFAIFEVMLSLALLGIMLPLFIRYVSTTLTQSINLRNAIVCHELADEMSAEFISELLTSTYSYDELEKGFVQKTSRGNFTIQKLVKKVDMGEGEEAPKTDMVAAIVVAVFPQSQPEQSVLRSTKVCIHRGVS